MIKIERSSVMNFDNAIRGARNPMNSWERSDSYYDENGKFVMGEADLAFGKRLVTAGPDHRKFIRQIFVSVDITAPLYWWKEFDTYKVGTVANSTSTMHKIHAKEFTKEDFSFERTHDGWSWFIESILNVLNTAREQFLETKDKSYWEDMIQFLPSSYNQMRTVTLNYENLINIYNARCTHKLDEWHRLCEWILTLPYADDLIAPALRQTKEKISKLVEKCNENLASDECCEGCFGTVLQGDCLFSNLDKSTIDALYESALKGVNNDN